MKRLLFFFISTYSVSLFCACVLSLSKSYTTIKLVLCFSCMQFFLSRHCEENCTCTNNTTPLEILQFEDITPLLIFERNSIQSFEVKSRIVCNFRIRRHSLQKRQIFTHRGKIRDSVKNFFVCIIHKIRVSSKPSIYEITLNIILGNERAKQKTKDFQ